MLIFINEEIIDPGAVFMATACEFINSVAKAIGCTKTSELGSGPFTNCEFYNQRICYNLLEIVCKDSSKEVDNTYAEDAAQIVCEMVLIQRRSYPDFFNSSLLRKRVTARNLMGEISPSGCMDDPMNRLIHLREVCKGHNASKVHAFRLVLLRKKSDKFVCGGLSEDIVRRICSYFKSLAEAELSQHLEDAIHGALPSAPYCTARRISF
jgi:hypothetical protein